MLWIGLWVCIHNTSYSSYFTNGPNKLDCLPLASLSWWFYVTFQIIWSIWKWRYFRYGLWVHIQNTSFSSYFTNGPNKLDCFPLASLSWWIYVTHMVHLKMYMFWIWLWVHIHNTSFSSYFKYGSNKLDCLPFASLS